MFKKIVQTVGYPIVRLFYNIELIGKENFIQNEPFVFVANHTSNLDVVVLYLSFNRPLNFMAKKELFSFKPLGWILKKLGAFPIDRNANDLSALKKAMSILRHGEVLAIFPQGTRKQTLDVDDAKSGAVLIASKCKVPVLPVAISGKYKFRGKITINIDKPYYFEPDKKLSVEDCKEVTREIFNTIKKNSEE